MKIVLALAAASSGIAFAAPPVLADEPKQDATEEAPSDTATASPESAETAIEVPATTAPDPDPAPAAEPLEEEEEARICRSIRADASSRRKTRVCLTREQWREYNNRR